MGGMTMSHMQRQAQLVPLAREMGRAVAVGALPLRHALAILDSKHPDCPVGLVRVGTVVHDTARQHELDRILAESRVERVAWPLCEDRAPGHHILAETAKVAAPLRQWEVLEICRRVASRFKRGRHGGHR